MDLNKVMIIGNITQQPEARVIPSGQSVSTFSIATNRVWSDQQGQKQERVEFHNIVAWGKLADICNQYLQKGKKIYVEGRLQTRDWAGQDGVKRYRTEIIAENMIMLDRMSAGASAAQSAPAPTPAPASAVAAPSEIPVIQTEESANPASEAPNTPAEKSDEIKVEDIPF